MTGCETGYLSWQYADALNEFGTPRQLPRSGSWILERPIADTGLSDAMGLYPLLSACHWPELARDIEELAEAGLVSLVAVADPLGDHNSSDLQRAFPDLLKLFKQHFITNLSVAPETFVSSHHQRNARKALAVVDVHIGVALDMEADWIGLYSNLVAHHSITGIAAFSSESLRRQLHVPGSTLFCARREGRLVGATLWYVRNDSAYYHLGAYSDEGYALRASFGLFWRALHHFLEAGVRTLDLGAGAGLSGDTDDGLSRFKRGWATGTLPAYLCGRILDPEGYAALCSKMAPRARHYFPIYRKGEFG
jgi:hypothetical protein